MSATPHNSAFFFEDCPKNYGTEFYDFQCIETQLLGLKGKECATAKSLVWPLTTQGNSTK